MNRQHRSRTHSNVRQSTYDNDNHQKTSLPVSSNRKKREKRVSDLGVIGSNTRQNREPIVVAWLDLQSQFISTLINSFRTMNNFVQTYTDASACLEALQLAKEKIFVILSSSNEELIQKLHVIDSIEAIFVLDPQPNPLTNEYPKLLGVFKRHEELLKTLKQIIDIFQQIQLERFTFEEENEFLWIQLWKDGMVNGNTSTNTVNDFLQTARTYYRHNPRQIRLIDDFQRSYYSKNPLRWCCCTPFPANLLRHALMFNDFDQLSHFRFLIADATQVIQKAPKHTEQLQFYRVMKLSNQVIDRLERHVGRLVRTSGYFWCAKSRTIALQVASHPGYRFDLSSVLFEIECAQSTKFAEIAIVTRPLMPLFDIDMVFRIISFTRGTLSVIKMKTALEEGKRLARQYRDNHRNLTVKAMLNQLLARPRAPSPPPPPRSSENVVVNNRSSESRSTELEAEDYVKNNRINSAIVIYQRIHPVSVTILLRLGQLYADKKGDYDRALDYYTQALQIQKQTGEDIWDTLTQIASLHHERREFDLALASHTSAFQLRTLMNPSNRAAIATNLVGLANAHRAKNELSKALDYAKQALAIRESIEPIDEASVGKSLATMANIYHELGDNTEALEVGMRAFHIFQRIFPRNSPELAGLLNNLGAIKLKTGDLAGARHYFEQSIDIYRQILPASHPNIAKLENNIKYVTQMQHKELDN